MVEYSTWVSAVRAEASAQGADLSDFETNSQVVSVAAGVWNDRKDELKDASGRMAEQIAAEEVSVS